MWGMRAPGCDHRERRLWRARYRAHGSPEPWYGLLCCSVNLCVSIAWDLTRPVFCVAGDNILLPKPGFPLYQVIAETHKIECRFYNLDVSVKFSLNSALNKSTDDGVITLLVAHAAGKQLGGGFGAHAVARGREHESDSREQPVEPVRKRVLQGESSRAVFTCFINGCTAGNSHAYSPYLNDAGTPGEDPGGRGVQQASRHLRTCIVFLKEDGRSNSIWTLTLLRCVHV